MEGLGQQSRGSGTVTLVFSIESQGAGDVVGLLPFSEQEPCGQGTAHGETRARTGRSPGAQEEGEKPAPTQSRGSSCGTPKGTWGLFSFLESK